MVKRSALTVTILKTQLRVVCHASLHSRAADRTSTSVCNVPLVFHIDKGDYDGVALDGLNVVGCTSGNG